MTIRICLATDSLEPSGVGEHMLALAVALKGTAMIVIACPESPGGRSLLDRAADVGLGIRLLGDDTEDWFRRSRFDVLHVHAGIGWEGHALAAQGRAGGVPRVLRTEHLPNVITDEGQRHEHAQGLALIDRVICVSAAAGATFLEAGIAGDKLTVIRNGMPHRSALRDRAGVRRALDLSDDQPVVLTTARFTPQKDHATLIGAAPAILAQHPNCCFLLAGEGPTLGESRALADGLGVHHALRFLGHRADVPDLLGAADLFVLSSRFEGLPLAIIEAMDAALPVVSTAVGGTDEVVVDGVTGRLVAPGDAAELASAVTAILADRVTAAAMGDAARARFESHFTASRMAEETAKLYGNPADRIEEKDGARMDGGRRVRIGFIGVGGIAQRHLGVLEQFEDVELAAFADPAQDRATAAAERFGSRSYADYNDMLAVEALDAVYICVPPFAHGAPERAVIAKGIPFFVEKPLALDLPTAEAIAEAVSAKGLITGVGYHWRYLDTVDEAKARLADNPAQLLSGYWLDSTPPPRWWWRQDQSGGQMIEQTTHIVDLARYLAGDVVQVFGLAGHKPRDEFPDLNVATASTASLRFRSGALCNLASTCLLRWNHRVGLHVFADGLAMELTDHDLMVDTGQGRPFRHAEGDPVWREDRDFVDAVKGEPNRIRVPYAEALETHRVTVAIGQSAESGRAVDLASSVREPAHV